MVLIRVRQNFAVGKHIRIRIRPSLLDQASEHCREHNSSFITPPSIDLIYEFMENNSNYAEFWTPVKRFNSTHYSDSGEIRKISDFNSSSPLAQNQTCLDWDNLKHIHTNRPMLNWTSDFIVTSKGQFLYTYDTS